MRANTVADLGSDSAEEADELALGDGGARPVDLDLGGDAGEDRLDDVEQGGPHEELLELL